jgi:hypothetical protein
LSGPKANTAKKRPISSVVGAPRRPEMNLMMLFKLFPFDSFAINLANIV